ncbi:MAG TPA: hypothetical protein PK867_16780, partial [Pirellulales bacterium]|nr:hypothetical protein [Pirellulales bacterium]
MFTNTDGETLLQTSCGEDDDEAVNGVAINGRVIGISSRHAISFWTPSKGDSEQWHPVVVPCGSHG